MHIRHFLRHGIGGIGLAASLLLPLSVANAEDAPYALLIASGHYPYFPSHEIPQAASDAEGLRRRLIGAGFRSDRIRILSDAASGTPTPGGPPPQSTPLSAQAIRDAIRQTYQIAGTASGLVVFYSGHGILYNNQSRLVPGEFRLGALQPGKVRDGILQQTIGLDELMQLSAAPGRPTLLILDACRDDRKNTGFSALLQMDQADARQRGEQPGLSPGGTFDGIQPAPVATDVFPSRPNLAIAFAAVRNSEGQPGISYAEDGAVQSVFTHRLVDVGLVDDGSNDLRQIFPLLQELVHEDTQNFQPFQLPFLLAHLPGPLTLRNMVLPPGGAALGPADIASLVEPIKGFQADAVRTSSVLPIVLPPRYGTATIASLIAGVDLPFVPVRTSQNADTAGSATAPTFLTGFRVWQPETDFRSENLSGPVSVSNATASATPVANGIEFRATVSADQAFVITGTTLEPKLIDSVIDVHVERSASTATIVWRVPADAAGKPAGLYAANVKLAQRRETGSIVTTLGSPLELKPGMRLALPVAPERARYVDRAELLSDSKVILVRLGTPVLRPSMRVTVDAVLDGAILEAQAP